MLVITRLPNSISPCVCSSGVRLRAVAARPVRAAEPGARQPHGRAREHDQRADAERRARRPGGSARGETCIGHVIVPRYAQPVPDASARGRRGGRVEGVPLPHERVHTLKERALHPFRRIGADRLQALDDVSFAVAPGRVLRHRRPQRLRQEHAAEVPGRASTGSTGRDPHARPAVDVHRARRRLQPRPRRRATTCCINGDHARAARRRRRCAASTAIIEFAELEEFVDLKLKNYSSGMQVRLAFSVMIQVDADILLIDEVLAVGDAAFQQKCFDVFQRMQATRAGRSSSSRTTWARCARFCDRAMLLERGRVELIGDAATRSATRYLELQLRPRRRRAATAARRGGARAATGSAEIVDAWFEDEDGARTDDAAARAQPCTLPRARRASTRRCEDPTVALLLENERHHPLFAISNEDGDARTGAHARRRRGDLRRHVRQRASRPGRCYATPWMVHAGGAPIIDRRPRMASAVVTGACTARAALVDLPLRDALRPRARRRATPGMSAAARAAADRRARPRSAASPRRFCLPRARRSRSPTSSCASSARCSATCGSSCGRCCCSACCTSCSRSS